MILNIHGLLKNSLKVQLSKDIFEIMFDAIDQVELAFQELSESPLNKELLTPAYSPQGEKHIDDLLRNCSVMRTF